MNQIGFSESEIERYSRHILLPEIGGRGQAQLAQASAFVVGAGGLGSAALLYLAAAGIGTLGIADNDAVELSNLQRQIIHGTSDLARNKAESAAEAVREINPHCEVEVIADRLDAGNIQQAIRGYDVVLDGSDNFPTRYLVADCCWLEAIPLVTAAIVGFEGQLMTVLPADGNPCYRCLYPEPPCPGDVPTCQRAGVFGPAVGVMGTLQAAEAAKVLLGIGADLSDRLLVYDALACRFVMGKRHADPLCSLCSPVATLTTLAHYDNGQPQEHAIKCQMSTHLTEISPLE